MGMPTLYVLYSLKKQKKNHSIYGVKKFHSLRSEFHSILTPLVKWKFVTYNKWNLVRFTRYSLQKMWSLTSLPREWRQWQFLLESRSATLLSPSSKTLSDAYFKERLLEYDSLQLARGQDKNIKLWSYARSDTSISITSEASERSPLEITYISMSQKVICEEHFCFCSSLFYFNFQNMLGGSPPPPVLFTNFLFLLVLLSLLLLLSLLPLFLSLLVLS